MHRGMQGAQRCIQECVEVHGGAQGCTKVGKGTKVCRGPQKVTEVHRCMWRYMEGCADV